MFIDGGDVTLTLQLSEDITMQGEITGLCHNDIERFRVGKMIDDEEGDNSVARMIMEYLNVGTGLASDPENVEFTPFGFHMIITPNMKKILDVLRPSDARVQGNPLCSRRNLMHRVLMLLLLLAAMTLRRRCLKKTKSWQLRTLL